LKQQVTSDAIVTFKDGIRWAEPRLKKNVNNVIARALAFEPGVLGVAADIARKTSERLETRGVSQANRAYVFNQICLAGAIAIDLMKKGNAKLCNDLVEPSENGSKETNHE
jgi:hypothetical protein